jgi:hypothetical protein
VPVGPLGPTGNVRRCVERGALEPVRGGTAGALGGRGMPIGCVVMAPPGNAVTGINPEFCGD